VSSKRLCACGQRKRSNTDETCFRCRPSRKPDEVDNSNMLGRRGAGRPVHLFDVSGVMLTLEDLAFAAGVSLSAMHQRIRIGTPLLKARMRK
jgi:hypothetical protein